VEKLIKIEKNHDFRKNKKLYFYVKIKLYTPHIHWVPRGTGTPKDKDSYDP
jgi:hypothetical protein